MNSANAEKNNPNTTLRIVIPLDLTAYSLEDILLTAIKSEVDAKKLYTSLADQVKNGLLKDKLQYLATEEEKHRAYLKKLYTQTYPRKQLKLPSTTPIPLPNVPTSDEDIPLSTVISHAMKAEQAAQDFYQTLATKLTDEKTQHMIRYFADMERGHYELLKIEQQAMERFEEADVYNEMVHVGP
jgi:rubrerythrin